MGGVGKTMLLKRVYNKLLQDTSTSQPYWATVSHCDSVHKLQGSIAKCFGLDFTDEDDVMKRASILHSTLDKRGNIVLFLDDMRQPFFPDEVGIPLGENGCKIILTTHSLEVCRRMGCKDFVIKVKLLGYYEARALFIGNLEDYDKLTAEVKAMVPQVAGECDGLPLAIITMARRMSGVVDFDEWESVLDELRSFEQSDIKDEVYPKLQNSYDSLKEGIVKKCFLSSIVHLFRAHAPTFSRNCLVRHWIDEGLLDEIASSERLRKAHTIIDKLVDSCLLVEATRGPRLACELLAVAMAFRTAQKTHPPIMLKIGLGIAEVPIDELWSEDLVVVSLTKNSIKKIPSDMSPKCPKLAVLNLDYNPLMEVPESFFVHMTGLTVLNLSHTNIKILPNSVSNLKSLRVLKLAHCDKLARAPSLTTLTKLKVLDLWRASNVEGHMGLENLKLLEKLYFTWMSDWTHFNRLMESWPFSCLHTYRFSFHSALPNLEIDEESDEEIAEEMFFQFEFEVNLEIDEEGEDEIYLAHAKAMKIRGVDLISEKLAFPHDIEELKLFECVITNVGDALPPGSTMKLKRLDLYACTGIEYIVSAPTQMFSHLLHLSIAGCPTFKSFRLLNSVAQVSVQFLKLESLTLCSCWELEDFTFVSNVDYASPGEIGLLAPHLRVLELQALPQLGGTLCKGRFYATLRELVIFNCREVKEVFMFDPSQHSQFCVPNLEKVRVEHCENLEMIFSLSNNSGNPILVIPKLKLLKLTSLPKLRSIYRGVLLCTCIKEIYIQRCPNYQRVEELSKPVLCDGSSSTLASLPRCDINKDWWKPLRDFPEDIRRLSDLADKFTGSHQCEGPNSSAINTHQISTESELAVANQAFAPANVGMRQNFAQDFWNVGHPETGQNAVSSTDEWVEICIRTPEDENASQTLSNPIVMPPVPVPHNGQWQPYDPLNNEGSSSGYVWGAQHQQSNH